MLLHPRKAHLRPWLRITHRPLSPLVRNMQLSGEEVVIRSPFHGRSEGRRVMPEKKTVQKARRLKRQGKSPSTQAGEFVREEIHHIREGKHGARSTKQAIAIGL